MTPYEAALLNRADSFIHDLNLLPADQRTVFAEWYVKHSESLKAQNYDPMSERTIYIGWYLFRNFPRDW